MRNATYNDSIRSKHAGSTLLDQMQCQLLQLQRQHQQQQRRLHQLRVQLPLLQRQLRYYNDGYRS